MRTSPIIWANAGARKNRRQPIPQPIFTAIRRAQRKMPSGFSPRAVIRLTAPGRPAAAGVRASMWAWLANSTTPNASAPSMRAVTIRSKNPSPRMARLQRLITAVCFFKDCPFMPIPPGTSYAGKDQIHAKKRAAFQQRSNHHKNHSGDAGRGRSFPSSMVAMRIALHCSPPDDSTASLHPPRRRFSLLKTIIKRRMVFQPSFSFLFCMFCQSTALRFLITSTKPAADRAITAIHRPMRLSSPVLGIFRFTMVSPL